VECGWQRKAGLDRLSLPSLVQSPQLANVESGLGSLSGLATGSESSDSEVFAEAEQRKRLSSPQRIRSRGYTSSTSSKSSASTTSSDYDLLAHVHGRHRAVDPAEGSGRLPGQPGSRSPTRPAMPSPLARSNSSRCAATERRIDACASCLTGLRQEHSNRFNTIAKLLDKCEQSVTKVSRGGRQTGKLFLEAHQCEFDGSALRVVQAEGMEEQVWRTLHSHQSRSDTLLERSALQFHSLWDQNPPPR
jgi:hypothetical protein